MERIHISVVKMNNWALKPFLSEKNAILQWSLQQFQVKKIKASDFSLKIIGTALYLRSRGDAQDDITFQWVVLVSQEFP